MKDNYRILSTHWGLMRYLEEEMNRVCGVPKSLLSNDSTEKRTVYQVGLNQPAQMPSDMRVIIDPDMKDNEFIMSDGTPEGTRRFVIEE